MFNTFFNKLDRGYSINFEGMCFNIEFWTHANRRLRERLISRFLVYDAIKRGMDEILDCHLGERFALISSDIAQIVIAVMTKQGKKGDDYNIEVVTLIDDVELRNSAKYSNTIEINVG